MPRFNGNFFASIKALMFYPNRAQWIVIWLTVPLALLFWIGAADTDDQGGRLALAILVLGMLLTWALAKRSTNVTPRVHPVTPAVTVATQGAAIASGLVCPKCGHPPVWGETFCACGQPQLPAERVQKLTGAGGWLGLFCASLLVLQPLSALSFVLILFSAASRLQLLRVLPGILIIAGLAGYGFFTGLQLVRRRADAVRHAKQYLYLTLIGLAGLVAWALLTMEGYEAGKISGQFFWAAIAAAIWLSYFRKSKRVAITYGHQTLRAESSRLPVLAGALAILLTVGVPTSVVRALRTGASSAWATYAPPAAGFSVEMPGSPVVSNESVPTEAGTLFVTNAALETFDSAAFVISFLDFPADAELRDAEAVLDATAEGVLTESKLTVVDSRPLVFAERSGRELRARTSDGSYQVKIRLLLVDKRIYEIRAVFPMTPSTRHVEAADRFLQSFRLATR